MALHELIMERPFEKVAEKYGCPRGFLQQLQQQSATYANAIVIFLDRLGWEHMRCLLNGMAERICFGVRRELSELVQIEGIDGTRARAFFANGFSTLSGLAAAASPDEVSKVLRKCVPFESDSKKQLWLVGHPELNDTEAAMLIIERAKKLWIQRLEALGVNGGIGGGGGGGGEISTLRQLITSKLEVQPHIPEIPSLPVEVRSKIAEIPKTPVEFQPKIPEIPSLPIEVRPKIPVIPKSVGNDQKSAAKLKSIENVEKNVEKNVEAVDDLVTSIGRFSLSPANRLPNSTPRSRIPKFSTPISRLSTAERYSRPPALNISFFTEVENFGSETKKNLISKNQSNLDNEEISSKTKRNSTSKSQSSGDNDSKYVFQKFLFAK